jgi:hypothetical protein
MVGPFDMAAEGPYLVGFKTRRARAAVWASGIVDICDDYIGLPSSSKTRSLFEPIPVDIAGER